MPRELLKPVPELNLTVIDTDAISEPISVVLEPLRTIDNTARMISNTYSAHLF